MLTEIGAARQYDEIFPNIRRFAAKSKPLACVAGRVVIDFTPTGVANRPMASRV